jgi:hypothetical protein
VPVCAVGRVPCRSFAQIDTVKTRMQLQGQLGAARQYSNSIQALRVMAAEEGVASWFKGLSPALMRQATYGTVRYGAYEVIPRPLCHRSAGWSRHAHRPLTLFHGLSCSMLCEIRGDACASLTLDVVGCTCAYSRSRPF